MKSVVKSILVCLFLQASMLLTGNGFVSAQALYSNPDTIQQYLKDRITETKEQLKDTRAKLKEESGIMAFLTQPILSAQAVENVKAARRALSG